MDGSKRTPGQESEDATRPEPGEPTTPPLSTKGSFGTAIGAAMLGFEQALRDGPPPEVLAAEHSPQRVASGEGNDLVIEFPDSAAAPRPDATGRLAFREMQLSDLDFMAGLLGDPQVMRYYLRPYRRAEALEWIRWNRRLYRERGFGLWLVTRCADGVPIGDCGLTPQDAGGVEEIEVGYHIVPEAQGQGYATEAASAVRDFARTRLGLRRLVAIIEPANTPSRRIAEKVGLTLEREFERAGSIRLLYATDL